MPTWFEVPKLSEGPADGYVLWADFYRVHSMGLVDAGWITTAFETLAATMAGLGPFRVTTINPEWAAPYTPGGRGLRPGEYVHVLYAETTDSTDAEAGGDSLGKADRNGSLYAYNECRVRVLGRGERQARPPHWAGNCGAHEFGHTFLPSVGQYAAASAHTTDPGNVMYGLGLAESPVWSMFQVKAAAYQEAFLRRSGLRYLPDGSKQITASDGGRKAWPLQYPEGAVPNPATRTR